MFAWLKFIFQTKEKTTPSPQLEEQKQFPRPVTIPPAPLGAELPIFKYYTDPLGNKSIVEEAGHCDCCEMVRDYMYDGPIYTRYGSPKVCPWCVDNGRAAEMWNATFQDRMVTGGTSAQETLSPKIYDEVMKRTPGYSSWQGNDWLFSNNDAMIFLGDAIGKELLKENNPRKIATVLSTLSELGDQWTAEHLKTLVHGGQPSVYVFYDRQNDSYHAYQDFT